MKETMIEIIFKIGNNSLIISNNFLYFLEYKIVLKSIYNFNEYNLEVLPYLNISLSPIV